MSSVLTAINSPTGENAFDRRAFADISVLLRPYCVMCGGQGEELYHSLVDVLWNVPGNWNIRKCSACGVAWLDPQPIESDIPKLYFQYHTHRANPSKTLIARLHQAIADCVLVTLGYSVSRPTAILPRILSHGRFAKRAAALTVLALPASETGTLLDVGCGSGDFIARMHALGWKVTGVDPDPVAVSLGRRQGLEIVVGKVSDLPESGKYDVITMNHVVEHASDPILLLRECARRLGPGGRLIITTPNIKSMGHAWFRKYWRGLEVPRHFALFSPSGLRDCIARAGLSVQSMSTETRLAQMIYVHSACAKRGARNIAERVESNLGIKISARIFRLLEELIVRLGRDVGEEIFCVCVVRTNPTT